MKITNNQINYQKSFEELKIQLGMAKNVVATNEAFFKGINSHPLLEKGLNDLIAGVENHLKECTLPEQTQQDDEKQDIPDDIFTRFGEIFNPDNKPKF